MEKAGTPLEKDRLNSLKNETGTHLAAPVSF